MYYAHCTQLHAMRRRCVARLSANPWPITHQPRRSYGGPRVGSCEIPWGNPLISWDFIVIQCHINGIYPLVNIRKTIENCHV